MSEKIDLAADYKQSDLTRRMDLYLEYPEMRPAFIRIEKNIEPGRKRSPTLRGVFGRVKSAICRLAAKVFARLTKTT